MSAEQIPRGPTIPPGRITAPDELPPALVGRRAAAKLCGVSVNTWDRRVAEELTPKPLWFGQRALWRLEELLAWIEQGMPPWRVWHHWRKQRGWK